MWKDRQYQGGGILGTYEKVAMLGGGTKWLWDVFRPGHPPRSGHAIDEAHARAEIEAEAETTPRTLEIRAKAARGLYIDWAPSHELMAEVERMEDGTWEWRLWDIIDGDVVNLKGSEEDRSAALRAAQRAARREGFSGTLRDWNGEEVR